MSKSEGVYGSIVESFIKSVKSDLDSPVTSNFGNHVPDYRMAAQRIVEEVDSDAGDFERLRRASKEIEDTMSSLAKQLSGLGQATKELAEKWTSRSDAQLDSDAAIILLKMDLYLKHVGYTRSQIGHGEVADQLTRERMFVQHELCKFLLGVDSLEDRRGPQFLRHFMELIRNQDIYHTDHLKMNAHFRKDLEKLEESMMTQNVNRSQQRSALFDLKGHLEANGDFSRLSGRRVSGRESGNRSSRLSGLISGGGGISSTVVGIPLDGSLSEIALNTALMPDLDFTESGYLYKKSNKKLHKQWQKRRCQIKDGHFWLYHSDESLPPTKVNLLVCDCKSHADDPRTFDLYCRDRTYHLQADSETDSKRWILALKREIMRVKAKMLSADTPQETESGGGASAPTEMFERKLCILKVRKMPGNSSCADCSSKDDVQWLSNTGALLCIACSGVHRELGVHISRIQSLNLDVISSEEFLIPLSTGNAMINRLFEYDSDKCSRWKPMSGCTRFDRQRFIQMKYRDRLFVWKGKTADSVFSEAVKERDFEAIYRALLNPNLSKRPFETNEAFHKMVSSGNSWSLPVVELVVQMKIEIPEIETIINDCIHRGYIDMVTLLLRYRPLSSIPNIRLQTLVRSAEKTNQKRIVDLLNLLLSGDSAHIQHVPVPSALFISTPDSVSLSRSSSSVSPLPHRSPDMNMTMQLQPLAPVNAAVLQNVPITSSFDVFSDRHANQISQEVQSEQNADETMILLDLPSNSLEDAGVQNTSHSPCHHSEQPSTSIQKVPLATEVALQAPNEEIVSAHTNAIPNHYVRAPGDIPKMIDELSSLLGESAILNRSAFTYSQNEGEAFHERSSSDYSRRFPIEIDQMKGTVRSLPECSNTQTSRPNVSRLYHELRMPLTPSASFQAVSSNRNMNDYEVTPRKEKYNENRSKYVEKIEKDDYFPEACADVPLKGACSAFDLARASFMTADERARMSAFSSSDCSSRRSICGQPSTMQYRSETRSVRSVRPVPKPSTPIAARLKPPIPAPRKSTATSKDRDKRDFARRCRALYDCVADNPDELSFKQGDIIAVSKQHIAGESDTWMEGYLLSEPEKRGIFPVTFVTFLN